MFWSKIKKYELVKDNSIEYEGKTLYRIRALKDFSTVKKGDLGGYVESKRNLSQKGTCWIFDNAKVYGDARVSDGIEWYTRMLWDIKSKICNLYKILKIGIGK